MICDKINCIFIGVQKAGTSSFYNWVSQHPMVYGPDAAKDFPYFSNDKFYSQGDDFLKRFYKNYSGQQIVMQGNVNYFFFKYALERIKTDCAKDVKFVLMLRDPVKRAISSYNYGYKLGLEDKSFEEAIKAELNHEYTSFKDISDKAYIGHGYYYKYLKEFLEVFDRRQLHIIIFEKMIKSPAEEVKNAFKFLGIDESFNPDFKLINETGAPKVRLINKLLYKDNGFKNLVKKSKIFNLLFPINVRVQMRKKVREWNTSKKNNDVKYDEAGLYDFFKEDIANLEELIGMDLSVWKKYDGR